MEQCYLVINSRKASSTADSMFGKFESQIQFTYSICVNQHANLRLTSRNSNNSPNKTNKTPKNQNYIIMAHVSTNKAPEDRIK